MHFNRHNQIASLRASIGHVGARDDYVLPFELAELDSRLADGGLHRASVHDIAPASPTLSDDAAATLFTAGLAARLAGEQRVVLWVVTHFDLYAPGLEQVGLAADRVLHAEARDDKQVLALAEDGLQSGSLAAVIAEVRRTCMKETRRLQLATERGRTPMILLRRWRWSDSCPLSEPSTATTRWRIGSAPSARTDMPGVGCARWIVELVRQRNGPSFSTTVEACDEQGRVALPTPPSNRATASDEAVTRAA